MTVMQTKVLIAAVAVAAGLTPAGVAQAAQTDEIRWHKCQTGPEDELGRQLDEAGADCGEIQVPLDYSDPGGRTITVAMSRMKATERRVGAMMLNGGGPGGLGLDMPLVIRPAMKDVGKRYDLIGMDPRFVGRSTALDCEWPTGHWSASAGTDRAGFDRTVDRARQLAGLCAANARGLLPYATTRNTARDMDRIREALGEEKLSYFGYSYGSYLGTVYTQLFPGRADRVVIDGAVDPDRFGPDLLKKVGPVNEAGLRDWAGWVARHPAYGLGKTRAQVLRTVDEIYASAHRKPLEVGRFRVDEQVLPSIFFGPMADDRDQVNAVLAEDVQVLRKAARGQAVEPTESIADTLTFYQTGAESAYGSAQISIICGDRAADRDIEHYWTDVQRHRRAEPHFGATTRTVTPCAFWPEPPREKPTKVRNAVPTLIVAATGDPRTTYEQSRAMHRALSDSRLVTLKDARIHAVYGNYGNNCVDAIVNEYFDTGVLPSKDLTCR